MIESSGVGVSCSWFKQCGNKFLLDPELNRKTPDYIPLQQSYICSLSLGCMKNVSSTKIKSSSFRQVPSISMLHTASEFFLSHDVLEFIDFCITEKKQKMNWYGTEKTKGEVIDLTSDMCGLQSVSAESLWVVCNGFRLTTKEKQLLDNGGELTDRIIDAACSLLKKQFPYYGGLQTTLLQQRSRALSQSSNAMQVIHVHERRHWAVISTIGCDNSTVKYYDSFYRDISVQTVQTIVSLLNPCKSINAQIMDVQPQKGAADCGLYCLSYCVSLACKNDPCVFVYRQNEMRSHLVSCLENGILTEFPVVRKRRLSSSCRTQVKLFLCPVCLKPDDGETMVFCEKCKEWFHTKCIPTNDTLEDDSDWLCVHCRL